MTASDSPASRWLTVKWGPTIAAEAGELRSCFAYRSLSMNVISPGPASPTGRADWIATLPSPTKRPRTSSASCPTVATTRFFLSSLKGVGGDRLIRGRARWGWVPVRSGRESKCSAIASQRRSSRPAEMLIHLIDVGQGESRASGSRGNPPASPSIVRRLRPTSTSVNSRLHQRRQIRHMRQIGRPLGAAVEQHARKSRADRAQHVIPHVITHA